MKVISTDVVVALLDQLQGNVNHTVKMIEISLEYGKADSVDLRTAKANLELIETMIRFVNINSFEPSELYSTKDIA